MLSVKYVRFEFSALSPTNTRFDVGRTSVLGSVYEPFLKATFLKAYLIVFIDNRENIILAKKAT